MIARLWDHSPRNHPRAASLPPGVLFAPRSSGFTGRESPEDDLGIDTPLLSPHQTLSLLPAPDELMSQGNPVPDTNADSDPQATTPAAPTHAETDGLPTEADVSSGAADAGASLPRKSGPLAARGLGVAKPASPTVSPSSGKGPVRADKGAKKGEKSDSQKSEPGKHGKPTGIKQAPRPRLGGEREESGKPSPAATQRPVAKVAVPSLRERLSDDIQAELDAELASADFDAMMGGSVGLPDRKEPLAEGTRVHAQVIKIHGDSVFVSLGGPDEGVIPLEQFTAEEPQAGQNVEVMVHGVNSSDGLYSLGLPGAAVEVSEWDDIDEGAVVDVTITGHNAGGLECKLGGVRGFIPISQVAEYRVEDLSEFVDQKMLCVVTEANARRGNLVLSRRAVLEREREEKRKQQLEQIQEGDVMEGVVRSVKDFGAFVDLGGLDGLIHVSKLSWDRVKHPSEVLEVGQKVQVKIDRLDQETGKIGLSYRDLLDNPWDTAEAEFAPGTVCKGTISKIATFGCFVRLAPGVEGLVHISELAHHRISRVDTYVSEGQEVDVKVLSFDRDTQKISLSMKAVTAPAVEASEKPGEPEIDEPPREPIVKASHEGPLRGGNNQNTGGERFGLRW